MKGLDALRATVAPRDDTDPLDGLELVVKQLRRPPEVAKRRTPDGTTSIPLDGLQADPGSQRPIDREKLRSMVEHLRAGGSLKPPTVNERQDGSRWITDGQHRCAARALVGQTHVDAILTHKPSQEEAQDVEVLTKVAEHADTDVIGLLLGAGAQRDGKRLVLELGKARVSYLPHGGEFVAKTERGRLHVDAGDARDVLERLGLDGISLETATVPPDGEPVGALASPYG